jgi:hypothetical protein
MESRHQADGTVSRTRVEWEALEEDGRCPWCGVEAPWCNHPKPWCPKAWFDRGFASGFHDGANGLARHDWACLVDVVLEGRGFPDDPSR